MKSVSFWRDMLVFSVFWCYAKHFSIQSRITWQKYNKTKETLAMKTWETNYDHGEVFSDSKRLLCFLNFDLQHLRLTRTSIHKRKDRWRLRIRETEKMSFLCSAIGRINVGSVHFCKAQICWNPVFDMLKLYICLRCNFVFNFECYVVTMLCES